MFRHSYRNWLKRFNTLLETQRQLMRHADLKTTIETYGIDPDVSQDRREANSEVVKMLIGG